MLRKPSNSPPRPLSPGVLHYKGPTIPSISHVLGSTRETSLSDTDKSDIYRKWVASGRPHNFICSECRTPDNLILCGTCSRSYHTSCLSPVDVPAHSTHFNCPACRASQSAHSPSRSELLASSNASRPSTPGVWSAARVLSPPASVVPSAPNPLRNPESNAQSLQSTRVASPTVDRDIMFPPAPDAFDPSMLIRAREFLLAHGRFQDSQEFSVELLLKLGSMITELEFHRQQSQELMSENAHLRQDNVNIRAYLDSNLATGRPVASPVGDLSMISRPLADTSGKSWDRIVMDLI